MADLVITDTDVKVSDAAKRTKGKIATGVTVPRGAAVYIDPADNRVKLADNNATVTAARAAGMAEQPGGAGQWIDIVYDDPAYEPGATLVVGETYCVSDTPGAICPIADIGTGERATILFQATSATVATLLPRAMAIAHA